MNIDFDILGDDAPHTWRMVSTLGSWHTVATNKAFRYYLRVNEIGERAYFADYRIDNLVSRHHRVKDADEANQTLLKLTRAQLAEL